MADISFINVCFYKCLCLDLPPGPHIDATLAK